MKTTTLVQLLVTLPFVAIACGGSDDSSGTASPAAGSGGTTTAGSAGNTTGGTGGASAGSGGTSAGTGGTSAGTGGTAAGAGGTAAGGEGGEAGAAGSAGATGGTGGSAAGAGGSAAGAGGTAAGAGGSATATTTSMMCGSVPILGQQGFDTTAACSACVETSCCTEGAACGAITDCSPYRLCVAPCTTKACTDACDAMYPMAVKPSGTFATCRNTKCAKPCQDMTCLGNVAPLVPGAATFKIIVAPTDFQTGKAVVNATVKQCKRTDVTCDSPVDTQTTNAMGQATFAAVATGPKGLDDYFELTEAAYESTLSFDVGAGAIKLTDGATLGPLMISKQTWTLLTGVISATPDATRGHVAFLATACKGARASGVAVTADSSDAMTTLAYIAGQLPSKTATETDGSGAGAFVNLPPGPLTLTGKLVSSGATTGTNTVFTRAGYITLTNVIPTP